MRSARRKPSERMSTSASQGEAPRRASKRASAAAAATEAAKLTASSIHGTTAALPRLSILTTSG